MNIYIYFFSLFEGRLAVICDCWIYMNCAWSLQHKLVWSDVVYVIIKQFLFRCLTFNSEYKNVLLSKLHLVSLLLCALLPGRTHPHTIVGGLIIAFFFFFFLATCNIQISSFSSLKFKESALKFVFDPMKLYFSNSSLWVLFFSFNKYVEFES